MNLRNHKLLILILVVLTFVLVGCQTEENYDGKTKVVFHLEGGIYQNCENAIVYYYDFEEGSANYIKTPTEISNKEIAKSGFVLKGWYRTKTVSGDSATYSDPWDFATDKVSTQGVELYAMWVRPINYTFSVCYINPAEETVVLGSYEVESNSKFSDYLSFADKRAGYTSLGYFDSDGQKWNSDFRHPGGEQSLDVKVYVDYIEGDFAVVRNKAELKSNKSRNIYLLADIDMGGDAINFGNYKGIFRGNNHTISNAKVLYSSSRYDLIDDYEDSSKKSLSISLFGNTSKATIQDINFVNIIVDIDTTLSSIYKIYVAPIGVSVTDTHLSNITISFACNVSRLPKDFPEANLIIYDTAVYGYKDALSTITNCIVS